MQTPAVFAIPGDINRVTGGFIYERKLLDALRAAGRDVVHLQLPDGFPEPTPAAMAGAAAALAGLPAERPVILDGLVFGSIDPAALDAMRGPVVAMLHHPLGLETGLPADRAAALIRRETENLRRAAHVVVPSPHTARILRSDFGVAAGRITVAPPGFARPGASAAPVAKADPPLILSVGILHPRKGHDTLMRALARIDDLPWQAEIAGPTVDAAYAALLDRLRADLGLSGRIRLAGQLDEAALQDRYRAATVFALATHYEGYGMVLSEALSHGLPVVSCRVGAVPDTVPEGAGLLVPPGDPAALAAALRALLGDPERRRAVTAAARHVAASLPGWADTAVAMGKVLDSGLAPPRAGGPATDRPSA